MITETRSDVEESTGEEVLLYFKRTMNSLLTVYITALKNSLNDAAGKLTSVRGFAGVNARPRGSGEAPRTSG